MNNLSRKKEKLEEKINDQKINALKAKLSVSDDQVAKSTKAFEAIEAKSAHPTTVCTLNPGQSQQPITESQVKAFH